MYVSEFHLEHSITRSQAHGIVAPILGHPTGLSIFFETRAGHFPYLVRIIAPTMSVAPTPEQFRAIARALKTFVLTHDVAEDDSQPDDLALIGPDGSLAVVHADERGLGDGDLFLDPESRDIYRAAVARLARAATG